MRTLLSLMIVTVALAGCATTDTADGDRVEQQRQAPAERATRDCTGSRLCRSR
ncbi:hypothetical protein [Maricaulis sp.]|uniref:hypothetical protein n=1 Tax=Maricaulis sp. TaxID=1486257 RepID=UPI00260B6F6E|nr:hypothetical protein [Maricaulis sp.]